MFPWLFPYGLGGIGTTTLSDKEHKRHLLMYHDKCFQVDIIAVFIKVGEAAFFSPNQKFETFETAELYAK